MTKKEYLIELLDNIEGLAPSSRIHPGDAEKVAKIILDGLSVYGVHGNNSESIITDRIKWHESGIELCTDSIESTLRCRLSQSDKVDWKESCVNNLRHITSLQEKINELKWVLQELKKGVN